MQNTLLPCVRVLISLPLSAFTSATHLVGKASGARSEHETFQIHESA